MYRRMKRLHLLIISYMPQKNVVKEILLFDFEIFIGVQCSRHGLRITTV